MSSNAIPGSIAPGREITAGLSRIYVTGGKPIHHQLRGITSSKNNVNFLEEDLFS